MGNAPTTLCSQRSFALNSPHTQFPGSRSCPARCTPKRWCYKPAITLSRVARDGCKYALPASDRHLLSRSLMSTPPDCASYGAMRLLDTGCGPKTAPYAAPAGETSSAAPAAVRVTSREHLLRNAVPERRPRPAPPREEGARDRATCPRVRLPKPPHCFLDRHSTLHALRQAQRYHTSQLVGLVVRDPDRYAPSREICDIGRRQREQLCAQ